MGIFTFEKEQKVGSIGSIKVGGQPGENPPLMIGSMFHDQDRVLESRSERKFDRVRAADLIKKQEEVSCKTGIPVMVDLVAESVDEMKSYIDFLMSITDAPFSIDMWRAGPRMAAARYVASLGVQDRVLYNSFTHWDGNLEDQAAELKALGFRHVVVQTYEKPGQMPADTLASLRRILSGIGADSFDTVLVDTASVNLPATPLACIASRLIKEELGLPVGCCPTTTTATWKEARGMWGQAGFRAIDVSAHAVASLMWNDFQFYGPIVRAPSILPAIAAVEVMRAVYHAYETGHLYEGEALPINALFGEFAGKLREELGKCSREGRVV